MTCVERSNEEMEEMEEIVTQAYYTLANCRVLKHLKKLYGYILQEFIV